MARPIRVTNLPGLIRGSGESPTGRHSASQRSLIHSPHLRTSSARRWPYLRMYSRTTLLSNTGTGLRSLARASAPTFSGQHGIRGLLDKLSDNPGNDRQADQLDSQLQATDYQRHTPSCADKVAKLRLSSLDDILELQPSAEPSIFQLKYARASLAKRMHPSPDSGPSDTPSTSIKGPDAEHGHFHKVILTGSKPSGQSVTGK